MVVFEITSRCRECRVWSQNSHIIVQSILVSAQEYLIMQSICEYCVELIHSVFVSAPGTAPRNVQVRPLSSSTMVIQWDEPESPNGQVTVSRLGVTNDLVSVLFLIRIVSARGSQTAHGGPSPYKPLYVSSSNQLSVSLLLILYP